MIAEIKRKKEKLGKFWNYPRKCTQIKDFTIEDIRKNVLLQSPKICFYIPILNYFSLPYSIYMLKITFLVASIPCFAI